MSQTKRFARSLVYVDKEDMELKKRALIREAIYNNNHYDLIKTVLREVLSDPEDQAVFEPFIDITSNPLKRAIDSMSTLYIKEVNRDLGELQDVIDMYDNININAMMLDLNKKVNLHTDIYVVFLYINGTIKPILLNVNDCDIEETSAGAIESIEFNLSVAGNDVLVHIDKKEVYYGNVADKKVIPGHKDIKHNYSELPILLVSNNYSTGIWSRHVDDSLSDAAIHAALKMTGTNNLFWYNCFKMLWVSGKISGEVKVGPTKVLTVEDKDTGNAAVVGQVDMQVDFANITEMISDSQKHALNQNGIMDKKESANVESYKAGLLRDESLMEMREKQIPIYRRAEGIIYNIITSLMVHHHIGKVGKHDFNIVYSKVRKFESPKVEMEHIVSLFKFGLIDVSTMLSSLTGLEMSNDEAMSYVRENRAAYKELYGGLIGE